VPSYGRNIQRLESPFLDTATSLAEGENASPIADSSSSPPRTSTLVDHSWALLHPKTSTVVIFVVFERNVESTGT